MVQCSTKRLKQFEFIQHEATGFQTVPASTEIYKRQGEIEKAQINLRPIKIEYSGYPGALIFQIPLVVITVNGAPGQFAAIMFRYESLIKRCQNAIMLVMIALF